MFGWLSITATSQITQNGHSDHPLSLHHDTVERNCDWWILLKTEILYSRFVWLSLLPRCCNYRSNVSKKHFVLCRGRSCKFEDSDSCSNHFFPFSWEVKGINRLLPWPIVSLQRTLVVDLFIYTSVSLAHLHMTFLQDLLAVTGSDTARRLTVLG